MRNLIDCLIVGAIGGFAGTGELISRYREAPIRPLRESPGRIYVLVNFFAAIAALAMIRIFGWTFGAEDPGAVRLTQLLVAGFGSLALFRSSLFVTRAGGQDIGIGPSVVLSSVLAAADRSVDRVEARNRSQAVTRIMDRVLFSKAQSALPTYCLALMQNVSSDEKVSLANDVAALANKADMSERQKSLALGLTLLNLVGEDLLAAAVSALGTELTQ